MKKVAILARNYTDQPSRRLLTAAGFQILPQPAAALGAGIPLDDVRGCMVIIIGGSTTEISVVSMNGIIASRSTRTGSLALDEAIMRYVRREKGLIIGQRTAEDLKIDLGTMREIAFVDNEIASLRGRNARTGKPDSVEVSAQEIRKCITPVVDDLLESVREAFENTPAEMAEDILQRGICLCGGGALLEGLTDRLGSLLHLPVTLGEDAQDCVARGLCIAASDHKIAQRFAQSGCLIEL